jgi:hypothetical protein
MIAFTLLAFIAGGLFSCKTSQPQVYILPFKVYRVEVTETGFKYLYIWRYRIKGKIPATCIEGGNNLEVGDNVMIDIRTVNY